MFEAAAGIPGTRERSRLGSQRNRHPATRRSYPLRSFVFCFLCGNRMFGKTSHGTPYYVCQPALNLGEEAARRFPGHPPTVYVRQDGLLVGIFRFFAERIFGPDRRELLETDLRALQGNPERERTARTLGLRKSLADLELRERRLIRSLELDDDPDGTVFRRVRERLSELGRERRTSLDELTALERQEPSADPASAGLLDELPLGTMDLASAPADALRRLFEAFRLEILYEPSSHQARCRAWIGEDSLSDAVAEAGRVVRVDFAREGSASGRADVRSALGFTQYLNPLVEGPTLLLAPVHGKVRRAGYRKTAAP